MPRTESLRTIGLERHLNENYADKGGYTTWLAMKLAEAKKTEKAAHYGVDSRTIDTWTFIDDLGSREVAQ